MDYRKIDRLYSEIKHERQRLHKEILIKRKNIFRIMNYMLVAIILMNWVAVFTTNYMVMKQNPSMKLMEVNPIQATLNGYEQHPEGEPDKLLSMEGGITKGSLIRAVLIQSLLWFIFLAWYFISRKMIYKDTQLWLMFAVLMFYFSMCGWDMWNDLGYLVARIIYGG